MPCKNLINYAQGCSLLIHEATFADGFEQDALVKKHTTISQALQLIDQVKPWRSILTHFSVRNQKGPQILDKHLNKKTMVAFDHLRIKLSDLKWAYKLMPLFQHIFQEEIEGNDEPKD